MTDSPLLQPQPSVAPRPTAPAAGAGRGDDADAAPLRLSRMRSVASFDTSMPRSATLRHRRGGGGTGSRRFDATSSLRSPADLRAAGTSAFASSARQTSAFGPLVLEEDTDGAAVGAGYTSSSASSAAGGSRSTSASSVDVFAGFDADYDHGGGDDDEGAAFGAEATMAGGLEHTARSRHDAPSLAAASRQREAVLTQVFGHLAGVDVATSIARNTEASHFIPLDAPLANPEREAANESRRHRRVASDIDGDGGNRNTNGDVDYDGPVASKSFNATYRSSPAAASSSIRRHQSSRGAHLQATPHQQRADLGDDDADQDFGDDHPHHQHADIGYDAGHAFTPDVEKKLSSHESLDFTEPVTELYIEYLAEMAKRGGRRLKVVIIIAIGVVVGFWATLLFHTIDTLSALKGGTTLTVLADHGAWAGYAVHVAMSSACAAVASGCCAWYAGAAGSGVPEVMSFLNGVEMQGQFNLKILLLKTLSCTGAVVSGMPVGAEGPMIHIGALIGRGVGSGHSRTLGVGKGAIRAVFRPFLNARDRRDFVTTGAAAGVTSVFGSALGGLLFVMEEVASFFPQRLAWKTFVACLVTFAIQQLANSALDGWTPRKYDEQTPIHFFNPKAHTVEAENHRNPLTIHETAATLFNMRIVTAQLVPLDIRSLLPAALVGVATALIGVGFISLHLNIARRWRGVHIRPVKRRFVLEPVLTAAFFATVWFVMPLALPCEKIPENFFDSNRLDLRDLQLVTQFCDENGANKDATRYPSLDVAEDVVVVAERGRGAGSLFRRLPAAMVAHLARGGLSATTRAPPPTTTTPAPPPPSDDPRVPRYHSPFASLSMTSSYNAIRLLFSRHAQTLAEERDGRFLFPPYVVVLFLILYGFGAAYCVGMCMASGVVIPTLLIGALIGRLICGGWWEHPAWANAGIAAFVGAAGFFAGLSRLTFSVVVIMVEITNDLSHVPLLMVAVVVAKQLADRVNHSLYHEQLAARGVPFLDFDRQIHKLDCFTAGDIMSSKPTTLPIIASLRDIVAILRLGNAARPTLHHGFPVVRPPTDPSAAGHHHHHHHHHHRPKLLGLVTRDELRRLLWYVALWHRRNADDVDRMEPGLDDLVASASDTRSPKNAHLDDDVRRPDGASLFGAPAVAHGDESERRSTASSQQHQHRHGGSDNMPLPTHKDLQDVDDLRFWDRLPPLPEEFEALADNINRGDFDHGKGGDGDIGSDDLEALPPGTPIPAWLKRIANAPMDMTPFVNLSTSVVLDTTCVSQVYGLFRNLHLRHLCVVSSRNGLKGIITRRDLLGPSLAARCTQAFLKQRAKAEAAAAAAAAMGATGHATGSNGSPVPSGSLRRKSTRR